MCGVALPLVLVWKISLSYYVTGVCIQSSVSHWLKCERVFVLLSAGVSCWHVPLALRYPPLPLALQGAAYQCLCPPLLRRSAPSGQGLLFVALSPEPMPVPGAISNQYSSAEWMNDCPMCVSQPGQLISGLCCGGIGLFDDKNFWLCVCVLGVWRRECFGLCPIIHMYVCAESSTVCVNEPVCRRERAYN